MHATWSCASNVGFAGEETDIREEEVVERREGGKGHDKAREKVCVTAVRRARTWRRVRRSFIGGSEPFKGCVVGGGGNGSKARLGDFMPPLLDELSDCDGLERSIF